MKKETKDWKSRIEVITDLQEKVIKQNIIRKPQGVNVHPCGSKEVSLMDLVSQYCIVNCKKINPKPILKYSVMSTLQVKNPAFLRG